MIQIRVILKIPDFRMIQIYLFIQLRLKNAHYMCEQQTKTDEVNFDLPDFRMILMNDFSSDWMSDI